MSENRRKKRLKSNNKLKPVKRGVAKKDKIIKIIILIIIIILICVMLFLEFLIYFISI